MNSENNTIPFWKKIVFSIKNFEKYEVFLKEKKSQSTLYLLKLILLLSLVTAICMSVVFNKDFKKIRNYFETNITRIRI